MEIHVAATDAEREAIYRMRYEVAIEEMGLPFEADREGRRLPEAPESLARLLYAKEDGQPVATLSLQLARHDAISYEEATVFQFDRFTEIVPPERMALLSLFMAVPAYRASEAPIALLSFAVALMRQQSVQLLFCECRPHLINSYLRLGFRAYAKTYNDPAMGLVVPLVMVLDDLPYLQRIGSRLASVVAEQPTDLTLPARLAPILGQPTAVATLEDPETSAQWPDLLSVVAGSSPGSVALFDGIDEDAVSRVLEMSHTIECRAGDRIVSEETVERTIFVILQGTVTVTKDEQVVSVLSRGDIFGEISFLLKAPRTADVAAVSDDVRVLAIGEKNLSDLIASQSNVAARLLFNLARILASKLRER